MRKYLPFLLLTTLILSCTDNPKEKWKWDSQVYQPLLLRENDTAYDLNTADTLKAGEYFKAKLFKQFQNLRDSNGMEMIKEFKGYSFKILFKNDRDPAYTKSWTSMQSYVTQVNDTAFINIPIDSITKYSDKDVRWAAGYRLIFHKDNADTTYSIGGIWHLILANPNER
jgi:hypothetical protein